jgi:hypothetical protein
MPKKYVKLKRHDMLARNVIYDEIRMYVCHDVCVCMHLGPALGCWVKEGWDWLFIFLQDALLK